MYRYLQAADQNIYKNTAVNCWFTGSSLFQGFLVQKNSLSCHACTSIAGSHRVVLCY